MIEHSVFALPFAYIAALTAMWQQTPVGALGAAAADHGRDGVGAHRGHVGQPHPGPALRRAEPAHRAARTGHRRAVASAPPGSGRPSRWRCSSPAPRALSRLCLLLAPVAIFLLVLYSYGKRFTDFPQALLALAQFVAPVGAWLAVAGGVAGRRVALGLAVGTWIGGFDLIYSCQDAESTAASDRVRSPPASASRPRWCRPRSCTSSHSPRSPGSASPPGSAGCGGRASPLTALVLGYEHAIVARRRPVPGQPRLLHRQRRDRHRPVRLRARRPGRPRARPMTGAP